MLLGSVASIYGRFVLGYWVSTLFLSTPLYWSLLTLRGSFRLSGWHPISMCHPPSQFTLGSIESYPQVVHRRLVWFLGNSVV
jgi:hypothetical protein